MNNKSLPILGRCISAFFPIVLLFTVSFLGSCNKTQDASYDPLLNSTNQEKMVSFKEAGVIHNEVLSLISSRLKGDIHSNYTAMESQARGIATAYVSSHPSLPITVGNINEGYKLRPSIFRFRTLNMNTLQNYVSTTLSTLQAQHAIRPEEAEFVLSIFSYLKQASDKKTPSDLVAGLENLSQVWEQRHFNIKAGEGIISGYGLGIGKASAELWTSLKKEQRKEIFSSELKRVNSSDIPNEGLIDPTDIIYNPNDPDGQPFYFDGEVDINIANIIAADIAGAIGGAAGSILDNVFNKKPINWASAGAWAVGGAIGASSVGGIARLIKWIF